MKEEIKKDAEDSANVETLVQEIAKEQEKIGQREGDILVSHIHIGRWLAELRSVAKRTWGKQLRSIRISPRVAGRYLRIAANWPDEIGLKESDLLSRLPVDLLKLEWLCRVPLPRLKKLLDDLDCKKAPRPQVIAAVREALGEDPPASDTGDVEKFVDRLITRLVKTIDGLQETFPETVQQDRARKLLAAGLQQVQKALKASQRTVRAS